jgi:very-short-patch-repair endonuclease
MKKITALDLPFYFGASADIIGLASQLRKNMTPAEKVLWEKIRRREIMNCKFRRQHPISNFIADFYCHEKQLVIEVDGGIHKLEKSAEHDDGRDFEMNKFGIKVLRFTNDEVLTNLENVLAAIHSEIGK